MNLNLPAQKTDTGKRPIYLRPQLEAMFLPVEQMLQIDRVTSINGDRLVCEMDVPGHWVFPLHFPTDPIFPGTLLIEAAGQAVAVWGWHAGLRGRPRLVKVEAKFESPVLPNDEIVTLVASVHLRKNICLGTVELFVLERKVATVMAVIIIAPL
jgi:3-hydroxymyristoyl/3-hydroxydecanoyl-(acyl carrier protein) dehydratase